MISGDKFKISLTILFIVSFINQACAGVPSTTPFPIVPTTIPSFTATDQLDLSHMNVEEWASTSPNGTWIATGLVALPKENTSGKLAYVRLMIFSTDGKTHWKIIDEWEELGLGFPKPVALKWSQDGKHFYFTHRVSPDGCSAFPFLTDLQQVNLQNGIVENLLPDPVLALALSPDDSLVAYFSSGLILRDLINGEKREIKIDPGTVFDAGNLLWSPDSKSLALTLAINPCTGVYGISKTVWAESTTILWVDAKTLQQKVLVKEDPRLFVTTEWNEPDTITVIDGKENSLWYLNVNTGEVLKK